MTNNAATEEVTINFTHSFILCDDKDIRAEIYLGKLII